MTDIELPVEIWDIIAKTDLKVYRNLVRAIPSYGRRMSHPLLNRAMRIHFTVCSMNKYGTRSWYLHGELHREDGPAIEWVNGSLWWYLHGRLHRENGPAVEGVNGTREWWLHGQHHRDSAAGPAIEYANGIREWWLHGVYKGGSLPALV